MNYAVIDFEFNQGFDLEKSNKKCPFEIIQIGGIILNDEFEEIGSYNELVKPQIYLEINPYVGSLTGLTMEKLVGGTVFPELFTSFLHFLGENEITFCTWGMSDMKELFRNAEYFQLPTSKIPKNYINLQPYVSKYLHFPKHISVSLSDAIRFLKFKENGNFHDAYHDALYTSKILKRLSEQVEFSIQKYDPAPPMRLPRPQKQKVDYNKLLAQFEKMYNREMTLEEKEIIKLAYLMGKTGQFTVTSQAAPTIFS